MVNHIHTLDQRVDQEVALGVESANAEVSVDGIETVTVQPVAYAVEFEDEIENAAAAAVVVVVVVVEVMTLIVDVTEGHCDHVIIIGVVELGRAVRAVPEKAVPPGAVVVVPAVGAAGAEKRNIATIGRDYT